jgi:hypothetical protein
VLETVRITSATGPITPDTREFVVLIGGFTPTRDIVTARFRFTPSQPGRLAQTDFDLDVTQAFTDYFATPNAGGTFELVVPFSVEGSLLDIAGAAVTLVSQSQGNSNELNGTSDLVPH